MRAPGPMIDGPTMMLDLELSRRVNAHSTLDAIVAGIDGVALRGMLIEHQPIELQQVE